MSYAAYAEYILWSSFFPAFCQEYFRDCSHIDFYGEFKYYYEPYNRKFRCFQNKKKNDYRKITPLFCKHFLSSVTTYKPASYPVLKNVRFIGQ